MNKNQKTEPSFKKNKKSFQRKTFDTPRKKKALGQHFLRKQSVVDSMIDAVTIEPHYKIIEIGCGDGFLTRSLLQTKASGVSCYEIDPEWAEFVRKELPDQRLEMILQNVLEADWKSLDTTHPRVLLANLPYQVTFPILFKIVEHKHLFTEGVVMIQEEVAQKIVSKSGRGYGVTPLRMQYHFEELRLLDKIEPGAFTPPPSVFSRLLYFKPRKNLEPIPCEEEFWKFLGYCFHSPRQNLKNNIKGTKYPLDLFTDEELKLRAQQISWKEFLSMWQRIVESKQI